MKQSLKILMVILSVSYSANSYSQQSKIIGITTDYESIDSVNFQGDVLYNLSITVHLIDTINISKVFIDVGQSYNGNDVLAAEYNWFDSTLNSPNSIYCLRQFGMVTFKLPNVKPNVLYYKANTADFQNKIGIPYSRQH